MYGARMGDIRTGLLCGVGGNYVAVLKPYAEEFREDVVRVARNRGPA